MRKILRTAAAWALLLACVPGGFYAYARLSERGAGAYAPDGRWCGVLRVWAAPGLSIGSWLNSRAEAFERRNDGVRVQILEAEPSVLADFAISENPPDALVFRPGLLESPAGLAPIGSKAAYLAGLESVGLWQGERMAAPIALGAYARVSSAEGGALLAPEDDDARCWSGALLALCEWTGREAIGRAPSALGAFAAGEAGAICATQTELARLAALAEAGRAPEYEARAGEIAFTDQIALAAVARSSLERGAERMALSEAFIEFLLTEPSQEALAKSNVFRATQGEPLHAAYRSAMAAAEESLLGGILAPPAFGSAWRERCRLAAEEYARGGGDARALLRDALRGE